MKQDPPSFSITPERQYREETGRSLLIPCQGKHEDPTIKVTWTKVNPSKPSLQRVNIPALIISTRLSSRTAFVLHVAHAKKSIHLQIKWMNQVK